MALAVLIVGAIFLHEPIIELFSQRDKLIELVDSAGVFGPLVFVALQIVQVVFSPIPGNVVGLIGGFLFGWWGLLLTTIGSTLGFILIVLLVRKIGRPIIEKLFKPEQIKKFDYITNSKNAPMILFVVFLLPFFPDDLLSALAGLTKIRLGKLITICVLGRLPGNLLLNMVGAGVNDGAIGLIIGVVAGMVVIGGLIYWQRKWIHDFMHADNHWEYLRNSFKKRRK